MTWLKHVETLSRGGVVQFRPKGNSMQGRIESGQLVTIEPAGDDLKVGDAVMCKVHGRYFIHLIKAIRAEQYQIGNNKNHINGWCHRDSVYGKVVAVED